MVRAFRFLLLRICLSRCFPVFDEFPQPVVQDRYLFGHNHFDLARSGHKRNRNLVIVALLEIQIVGAQVDTVKFRSHNSRLTKVPLASYSDYRGFCVCNNIITKTGRALALLLYDSVQEYWLLLVAIAHAMSPVCSNGAFLFP